MSAETLRLLSTENQSIHIFKDFPWNGKGTMAFGFAREFRKIASYAKHW
jgi:hypothetical protein